MMTFSLFSTLLLHSFHASPESRFIYKLLPSSSQIYPSWLVFFAVQMTHKLVFQGDLCFIMNTEWFPLPGSYPFLPSLALFSLLPKDCPQLGRNVFSSWKNTMLRWFLHSEVSLRGIDLTRIIFSSFEKKYMPMFFLNKILPSMQLKTNMKFYAKDNLYIILKLSLIIELLL